ncbi:hypothetical protein C8J57DRAFT_1321836 [Mycena rebaudengoi]|nr:hypothetical protein C8J57DRAFT_1321836 [Mycena rebaudengoi]
MYSTEVSLVMFLRCSGSFLRAAPVSPPNYYYVSTYVRVILFAFYPPSTLLLTPSSITPTLRLVPAFPPNA